MYESAAICLYLCERHPEARLMPEIGSPHRGHFLQWMAFLTNTVQEALMQWHHSDHYAVDAKCQQAVKSHSETKLDRLWQQLDAVLGRDGPYLLGEQFSVADIYLVMLSRWTRNQAKPAVTYPNVKRCVELVKARPAYRRMLKAQGIEQP
jgi:glutathione S-transferase